MWSEKVLSVIGVLGGMVIPTAAIGLTFGVWVYQTTNSVPWGAITAVGFIAVELVGIGVIYGAFSNRLTNLETTVRLLVDGMPQQIEDAVELSILKFQTSLMDKYQTKENCEIHHSNHRSKGANG